MAAALISCWQCPDWPGGSCTRLCPGPDTHHQRRHAWHSRWRLIISTAVSVLCGNELSEHAQARTGTCQPHPPRPAGAPELPPPEGAPCLGGAVLAHHLINVWDLFVCLPSATRPGPLLSRRCLLHCRADDKFVPCSRLLLLLQSNGTVDEHCHYNHNRAGRDWPALDDHCHWTCGGMSQSPSTSP